MRRCIGWRACWKRAKTHVRGETRRSHGRPKDIGLAAPEALNLCLSARDAMHFLGQPKVAWR